jgi:2-dehydropantoate 2-reductase
MTTHDIVIYGAGSVGSSVGGWLAPHCPNLALLARGEHAAAMKQKGLTVFMKKDEKRPAPIPVHIIPDLSERPNVDIVIIAVKNYSLEPVAKDIRKKIKGEPLIVALQNGLDNQEILPQYFKRVIYSVICYNSWREAPGVVGANLNGPILLGTPDNDPTLAKDLEEVREIFSRGFDTRITEDLKSAALSKMIVNLTNSVLTLVGHGSRQIRSIRALKRIMFGIMIEGAAIARQAGFREAALPGLPSWKAIRLASRLPEFISDLKFKKTIDGVAINSMGQDVLVFHRSATELETLNGYFIGLADTLKKAAPYNRTIYDLCKKKFAETPFVPMDETAVWREIEKRLERR